MRNSLRVDNVCLFTAVDLELWFQQSVIDDFSISEHKDLKNSQKLVKICWKINVFRLLQSSLLCITYFKLHY